ncbi:DNA/RNA nuclease SfsA [Allofournierella sp.]|uniref:DNA/RNA nuclease SfsA n=1 Tax=Allofournierella sp. TaxID=1940256 RepID=UPI003AB37A12
MQYSHIEPATFLARPNRFVATVRGNGEPFAVHVKNTGRCAELLVPGAPVYLERSENPARKTPCDLVAVKKGSLLVNMDSAAPNAAAKEWLAAGGLGPLGALRAEYRLGDSRFDFYAEQAGQKMLVEVKGCTLETGGYARFPDAPTLRGLKHVRELTALAGQGWRCCVLIVIQMKGPYAFGPNWAAHPAFGEALRMAAAAGVQVLAYDCRVTPESMALDRPVRVEL